MHINTRTHTHMHTHTHTYTHAPTTDVNPYKSVSFPGFLATCDLNIKVIRDIKVGRVVRVVRVY